LLERFRRKVGTGWDDVRLAALDLSWGALDPATSVYAKVENRAEQLDTDGGSGPGVVAHDRVDDSFFQYEVNGQQAGQVDGHGVVVTRQGHQAPLDATRNPPVDTRAWLRGEMLRRFGQDIVAMSWSHITVRDRSRYSDGLFCLDISDPLLWTERRCGSIMRGAAEDGLTAAETLRRLAAVQNR
jgi:Pup amidohydrolase